MAANRQLTQKVAPERRVVTPVPPAARSAVVASPGARLQSRIGASGMQQALRRAAEPTPIPAGGQSTSAAAVASVQVQAPLATAAPPSAAAPGGTDVPKTAARMTVAPVGQPVAQPVGKGTAPNAPPLLGTAATTANAPATAATATQAKAAPLRHDGPDPELTELNAKVSAEAMEQARHPPAAGTVASAQAAAVAPAPAAQAAAAESAVQGMSTAPTSAFEIAAFKTALKDKLNEKMPAPNSAENAEKTLQSGTAQAVGAEMKGELANQKAKATGGLPAAAEAAPDQTQFKKEAPPAVAPLPVATALVNPGGDGVSPAPLPPAALDTSANSIASENQLAANRITEAQLIKSNEPSFTAASHARAQAAEHSATAPAIVRQAEAGIRADAASHGAVLVGKGLADMASARDRGFGKVVGEQSVTKSKDEQERQRIAKALDDIQVQTRTEVTAILDEMDKGAGELFDKGLMEALAAFDAKREELERRARLERAENWTAYLGPLGAAVGYFWSLGREHVDAAISAARSAYNAVVDRLIDEVANFVGTKLAAAKARIAQGRTDAEKFVAEQPASVRKIGEEALAKVSQQFDTLAGEIDERRNGLIGSLGDKYAEACAQVDAKAQAFRDENKSLWDRAKEAVAGVIDTLLDLRALLVAIAVRAAGVVDKILDDPIRFLKHLVTGVKMGLQAFVSNFMTHLKNGLFTWMFGTLSAAGIHLPERFDAKGIFGLIASVLGLTYANIRARAVLQLGEPMVARLEAVAEVFRVLIAEGPMGLWNMLLDKLEQLKEQVLAQIREMLLVQVIKAGIVWLIGLLNPASAFIKACKAIYDVVMFFVEKGKQIADFVNAVLDSLGAIASGQLAGVAKMVEGALANAVPVVIGFLASLLGLGGLSEKIKGIAAKIQAPVNKAIDWVIGKAVGVVKKVGSLFGGKNKTDHKNQPKQVGVKGLAEARMLALLGPRPTIDAAKDSVIAVKKEFAGQGLKALDIVDKEGDWSVMVEASPREELFKLLSTNKKYTVRFAAKLYLTGETDATAGTKARTAFAKDPKRTRYEFATTQRGAYQDIGTGILAKTADIRPLTPDIDADANKDLKPVAFVSGNTGDRRHRSNASHAEEQFATWLDAQDLSWRERVKRIEISITMGPCGFRHQSCVHALLRVKDLVPNCQNAVIHWDTKWVDRTGETTTKRDDVQKLAEKYQQVKGPIEGEDSEPEYLDIRQP